MKTNYHIDLEKYGLEKFLESLRKRELIPSRVVLKKKIEERFEKLQAHGIENLNDLIVLLKTKPKIEKFAETSGLPADYLTILKREAASYISSPVNLKNFPGIDTKAAEALETEGIKNTKHLFQTAQTRKQRDELARKTDLPVELLDELYSLSDLTRLYGVGPVFARIIFDVGIDSVENFIKHTAEEFIDIYQKKTRKKADFATSDIAFTLELAEELLNC
ncbi:MAG: DUF4332 domain-containing protein [Proteobacteria bacterium]|nr:DUF4332 domain-containing protein [Pseudomonadota bacterium]